MARRQTRNRPVGRPRSADRGCAVVAALLAALLLGALGAALILTTSTEAIIAGNFRWNREALRAASGALDQAISELATHADWSGVLGGSITSRHVDGSTSGSRTIAGRTVDLRQLVSILNCGRLTACADGDVIAVTSDRPWGANNPRWRVFGHGPLARQAGVPSSVYVVVLVADDPAENDGDALRDGDPALNPGAGRLLARADAFGPAGAHASVEVVLERQGENPSRLRVLAWRFPGS